MDFSYYHELLLFFAQRRPGALVEDLERAADELADLLPTERDDVAALATG